MKKFNISVMFALLSGMAMANGELVSTAVSLENEKEVETAADTAKWTFSGSMGVNANQAYFNDYCVDGAGLSVALDAYLTLNANMTKGRHLWENSLSAKYGMIYSSEFTGEDKIRKNIDELILTTKYGYKISKAWYVAAMAGVETQFTKGYDYAENYEGKDSAYVTSKFFAPGYVRASLGFEHIPNKYFSMFIAPASLRLAVCANDSLGKYYGMELDTVTNLYKHVRPDVGAYIKLKSDFDITKNLHFFSTLEWFHAYNSALKSFSDEYVDGYKTAAAEFFENNNHSLDGFEYAEKASYVDDWSWYIKWKLELLLKVSKYVNITFKTQLKYDNAEYKSLDVNKYTDGYDAMKSYEQKKSRERLEKGNYGLQKAGVQFWESASVGVSYTF